MSTDYTRLPRDRGTATVKAAAAQLGVLHFHWPTRRQRATDRARRRGGPAIHLQGIEQGMRRDDPSACVAAHLREQSPWLDPRDPRPAPPRCRQMAQQARARRGGDGQLRRRLELLERQGGERYSGEPWKLRVKMCDVYNERALTLLRGSGFVEAYHLLQAALELSLYTPESGHLCTLERGIGCLPAGRGTRLTALTLNNLGVYHRRKGGGRGAYQHLKKAGGDRG